MIKWVLSVCIFFLPLFAFAQKTNVESAKYFFNLMNKDNVEQVVNEFYSPDAEFVDPIHRIKGNENIIKYYKSMYANVLEIHFDFTDSIEKENSVVLIWTMKLRASKLNNGEWVTVDGNSVIKFTPGGKAFFHRDYFDMGEFIYERIPVLNFVVKKIKSRLKN